MVNDNDILMKIYSSKQCAWTANTSRAHNDAKLPKTMNHKHKCESFILFGGELCEQTTKLCSDFWKKKINGRWIEEGKPHTKVHKEQQKPNENALNKKKKPKRSNI